MVRRRLLLLAVLLVLPFAGIVAQLARMQLVAEHQAEFATLAQHVASRYPSPRRGRILARSGEVLAGNATGYDVRFCPSLLDPRLAFLRALAVQLERRFEEKKIPLADLEERLHTVCSEWRLREASTNIDGWVPLVDSIDSATAEELKDSLPRRHLSVAFELRSVSEDLRQDASQNDALAEGAPPSFVLWVNAKHFLRYERVLERFTGVLAQSDYGGDGSSATLRKRVASRLQSIELDLERERQRDKDAGVREILIRKKVRRSRRQFLSRYYTLVRDVPEKIVTELEYYAEDYPGLAVSATSSRVYPYGEIFGNLTGYLRPMWADDLTRAKEADELLEPWRSFEDIEAFAAVRSRLIRRDDRIAAAGLERQFDARLRGLPGLRRVCTDPSGRPTGEVVAEVPVQNGDDLVTTLDVPMQTALYEAFRDTAQRAGEGVGGGGIVVEVHSGNVLASVSYPSLDPNRVLQLPYIESMNTVWAKHGGWHYDRASRMRAPPGSIFKLVWALAALEDGPRSFDPHEQRLCSHVFEDTGRHCNSSVAHGMPEGLTLSDALAVSCNSYFYQLAAYDLPIESAYRWASQLGYGRGSGIDLPTGRHRGILKKPSEVKTKTGRCFYGIGQVYVVTNPAQAVRSVAALAREDGAVPRPRLVPAVSDSSELDNLDDVDDVEGSERASIQEPADDFRLDARRESLTAIREGMWDAAHLPRGSGAKGRIPEFRVAVKTGTAELRGGKDPLHVAWLVGFAPAAAPGEPPVEPQVAFAFALENTRKRGGDACADVLVALLEDLESRVPGAYRWTLREGDR